MYALKNEIYTLKAVIYLTKQIALYSVQDTGPYKLIIQKNCALQGIIKG